jgi:hypothetical protein
MTYYPWKNEPLYQRAWALEERLLSDRVLIFGYYMMFWECQSGRYASATLDTKDKILSHRIPAEVSWRNWLIVIRDYTYRSLTVASDKLPALSGLAQSFAQKTGYTYMAGMWKETLVTDLFWTQRHVLYGKRAETTLQSLEYRAPSWSWASVEGNIWFDIVQNF